MMAPSPDAGPPEEREGRTDLPASDRSVDWLLITSALAISALGLAMVYSATRGRLGPSVAAGIVARQAVWMVAGVALMLSVCRLGRRGLKLLAAACYLGTVLALAAVLSPLGSAVNGSSAWFHLGPVSFQPSEPAKVGLVLVLAGYCARHEGRLDAWRFAVALVVAGVPLCLVLAQPDLGTAAVIAVATLAVLVVGGARLGHVALVALAAGSLFAGMLYEGMLRPYQVERLAGFLEPGRDPYGSTYHIEQSAIAIGSGGLAGQGFLRGPQTRLAYVPEQHTDFIFSAVGEELGLAGAATLLGLFALLLWRVWETARRSPDLFGLVACVGVFAMICFQVFQSAGMAMGLLPVTGVPLPLVSYGGSSTLATFLGLGVVASVSRRPSS